MNLEKKLEESSSAQGFSIIKNKRDVERALRRLRKGLIKEGYKDDYIKMYCGRGISPKKLSSFLLGNARYWSGNTKTKKDITLMTKIIINQ